MEYLLALVFPTTLYVLIICKINVFVAVDSRANWIGLRLAYYCSSGFVLVCMAVFMQEHWSMWNPTLFAVVFVGSGLLAGVRVRLGIVSSWLKALSCFQSGFVCLTMPVVLIWAAVSNAGLVYHDSVTRVGYLEDWGFTSNNYKTVVVYQKRYGVFEQKLFEYELDLQLSPAVNAKWWSDVYRVECNALSGRLRIYKHSAQWPVII